MKDMMTLGKTIEEEYRDEVILQDKLDGFADKVDQPIKKKKDDDIDEDEE